MSVQNSAVAVGLALLLAGGDAAAHETKDRVKLDWKRDPKSAAHPVDTSPPPAPAIPQELAATPAPRPQPAQVGGTGVEAEATRAADEMAAEAVRTWGWREYWRVGFARGVGAALDDPRTGTWDHEAGLRFGRSDPRVRALGDHFANEAAEGIADGDAESRVKERFMDLSKEPRANPVDLAMRTEHRYGPAIPEFGGPYATEPVLDEVFAYYPPSRATGLSREGRRAMDAWRVEPATLARSDRQTRAYDATWRDPGRAFAAWKERQSRGSAFWRLPPPERERFRAAFNERFESAIRSTDMRLLNDAWRIGFADGWRYGAAVQSEWAYRRGYAEGFDAGVKETASIAFPYAYEKAYNQAYARWFDEWSHTAHPGIGNVRLTDENGDGVYEPGERALLAIEVVNYGGGFGTFDLIASGADVLQPATVNVRLVGRGRLPESQKLSVQVADRAAPRTRSTVIVAMADARVDTPLYISRPFEVMDAPTIDADRLAGRVTLSLAVQNTSRRDAPAVLRVDSTTGTSDSKREDLGVVPSGGSKRATVTFAGIHPLDLIGAESRWRVSVVRGEQVDDTREIRMAPVATDLTNPDLLDFMLALARTADVSRSDGHDARALMMQRLRADWERSADADGNPYRRDFETEGSETVLGQLVRVREGGRTYASPQVFDGMDRDAEALAEDLPGAHPLLRKWMIKLAKRLK
jgi:hypothetical protein